MIVSGRVPWTKEFSLTSLSRFRRPISLGMFVLLWKRVILRNEYIKICFLACKRHRNTAPSHSPGCRRYCAPSLYGKAKRDIDPWHPNLCFKLPFSELTNSCQLEKPRLELKFKQWCAAGSTCFAPNVCSRSPSGAQARPVSPKYTRATFPLYSARVRLPKAVNRPSNATSTVLKGVEARYATAVTSVTLLPCPASRAARG